jgi:His/Glu/Gln/Arg/opine family amino acid ABC transporter permease subunit
MVQAYPEAQFSRVWVSVGIVVVLTGLSAAAWRVSGKVSVGQITRAWLVAGSTAVVVALLAPGELTGGRGLLVLAGVIIAGSGYLWKRARRASINEPAISAVALAGLGLILIAAVLWTIKLPVQEVFADGTKEVTSEVLARTTKLPWTILLGVLAVSYAIGVAVRDVIAGLRRILVGLWAFSFPAILMVVMRAPDIEWDTVFTVDVPIFLVVGVVVGVILFVVGGPETGEWKYIVSALWLVLAIMWVLFSWYVFDTDSSSPLHLTSSASDVLQRLEFKFPVILGALFALAAPSFGGARAARLRYVGLWLAALALLIASFRLGAASSLLQLSGSAFVGGLSLTFTLAIAGVVLSFPLGVLLALGRASTMPIVRLISMTYIELVRSVPLITWLYIGSNLLNLFLAGVVDIFSVVRAIIAITLFSAAYLAENVRGGLQSIPKGQYEAADAVGMSVVQKTVLITLPQALKAVIPALVGQVISLFKDTSLVSIIGLFDLLLIARTVIPGQSANIGSILELTVVAAAIYWVFTFTFSRSSMRLERRLGLGTR